MSEALNETIEIKGSGLHPGASRGGELAAGEDAGRG